MYEIIKLGEALYCFVMLSSNNKELFVSKAVDCKEYVLADIAHFKKEVFDGNVRIRFVNKRGYSADVYRNGKIIASAGYYTCKHNAQKIVLSATKLVFGKTIDKTEENEQIQFM